MNYFKIDFFLEKFRFEGDRLSQSNIFLFEGKKGDRTFEPGPTPAEKLI
jgi:hypothetical protein